MFPTFIAPVPSYSAAILAAVGVLRGRRFNGGNRKGCKVRLLLLVPPFTFLSLPEAASTASSRLWRVSRSGFVGPASDGGVNVTSAVDVLVTLLVSCGRLDFRAEKKG